MCGVGVTESLSGQYESVRGQLGMQRLELRCAIKAISKCEKKGPLEVLEGICTVLLDHSLALDILFEDLQQRALLEEEQHDP